MTLRALPKLPPPFVARAIFRLADLLAKLRRRLMPPALAAIELGTSSWAAMAIAAFAELRVAEALSNGALTAEQLAPRLGVNPQRLYRLLRTLTGYGIVREDSVKRFALTAIGRSLAESAGWSARGMVRYANADWHLAAWEHLTEGVRTGSTPFEITHGQPLFEYCAAQPEAGAAFDEAMRSIGRLHVAAVLDAYDFGGFHHVVDIGGGDGNLLAAILGRYPSLRGTLYETPPVIERAKRDSESTDLGGRFAAEGGDFFSAAPAGGDAYLLSHVLHDWDDAAAARILCAIHSAMPAHARVLIVEIVMDPPNDRWTQGKLSDLQMLVMLTGRERTREEFATLLKTANLRIARIVRTAAAESVIEAVRSSRQPD